MKPTKEEPNKKTYSSADDIDSLHKGIIRDVERTFVKIDPLTEAPLINIEESHEPTERG